MHRIFQSDTELRLFLDAAKTERLDYACHRYVSSLQHFFTGVWELRLTGMDMGGEPYDHEGLRDVYWNHDEQDEGFRGPHSGILESKWEPEDKVPADNLLHPKCLYMSGTQTLDIHVNLANEIKQDNGTLRTKWITLDQALDDADNQFRAVMDRLIRMKHVVDSNHGRMVVGARACSISRCIRIVIGVHYEVHVYDKNTEEPCPYHLGQPAGAIAD